MSNPENFFFYCPAHKVRIRPNGESAVLCEQGGHELGAGFPDKSWWNYCCDCATFWPGESMGGSLVSPECLICERQIAQRYLCAACLVISVESAAVVRRKSHSIEVAAGISPSCPGCKSVVASPVSEHTCSENGLRYLTARPACLFCEEQIVTSEPEAVNGTGTLRCWSCQSNLTAPFKFCKRCGSVQDQKQTETADVPESIATTATADNLFVDDEINTQAEINAESVPDYLNSWQHSAATPPKRHAPSKIAVAVFSIVIGIVVILAWFYSNPKVKRPDAPTVSLTPVAPAGMVLIPGGEFLMGNDEGDEYERPAHRVSVPAFFLDITEVTCEKYQAFIKETGHRAPPQWTKGSYPSGAGNLPVTGVDWYDASAYAQWARKRLPTEEEWEFAARSNDGRKYPWGNTWMVGAANAGDSSPQRLLGVGSHPNGKTQAGLMDMIGNAWEWTTSDLDPYPNGKLTRRPTGDFKVIRGGSWQELPDQATTTYRGYLRKTGAKDYSATGFRCAKDAKSESLTSK